MRLGFKNLMNHAETVVFFGKKSQLLNHSTKLKGTLFVFLFWCRFSDPSVPKFMVPYHKKTADPLGQALNLVKESPIPAAVMTSWRVISYSHKMLEMVKVQVRKSKGFWG